MSQQAVMNGIVGDSTPAAQQRVHAERGGGPPASSKRRLRKRELVGKSAVYSRGHVPWKVLRREWNQVRGVLVGLLHVQRTKAKAGEHWKRVEMVMLGLKLQAISGKCYAKARTFASVPFDSYNQSSTKTWYRTVALLKERELIRVARLIREENNTEAENLIDFAELWALIVKLLKHARAEVVEGELWVKISGFWKAVSAVGRSPPDGFALEAIS